MSSYQTTECLFELEPGWSDETGYVYVDGDVRVVVGPFAPEAEANGKLEQALERFRLAVPSYELLERQQTDSPVRGSELIAHRLGGALGIFEISVFWRLGQMLWVIRAAGPSDAEPRCRAAVSSFCDSYEPIEAA